MNYEISFPTPGANQSLSEQCGEQFEDRVIGDFTWHELDTASGIFNESGRELTNLEAIKLIETAIGAPYVFVSSNGCLSEGARQYNAALQRETEFNRQVCNPKSYKVAVVARYPRVQTQESV